jgi:hypothetical protein
VPKKQPRRNDRAAREAASRAKRITNAAARPPRPAPATEASVKLAAALEDAGLPDLAERARRLHFDELYGPTAFPMFELVRELTRAGQPSLIDRVTGGEFDATEADHAAYERTPAGAAEAAEMRKIIAEHPELAARAEEVLGHIGRDPRLQRRIAKEAVAEIAAGDDPRPPYAVDDDAPIEAADVMPGLRGLLGQRGPGGERLDTPEVLAAAELGGRTGAQGFELGWSDDEPGTPSEKRGWYARAAYRGAVIAVDDHAGPSAAALAFAQRVMENAQCQHCKRLVTLNPAGAYARDVTLLDGRTWSAAEQAAAGLCVWRREHVHWLRGCA